MIRSGTAVKFKSFMAGVGIIVMAALWSTAASAAPTGGIGGRPANPDTDNARSRSIFINTIDRGKKTDDAVLIANNSDQKRTIELYATDGIMTNTGSYTCRQKSESLTDSGKWIKLSKKQVTLEPGKDTEVPFTITVPDNADVGEHNACLVFADVDDKGERKGNLRVRTRQAVRVVTTIPGKLHREVALKDFQVNTGEDKLDFALKVENKGNVSADVDTHVRLKTLFGGELYKDGGTYPVFPARELSLSFTKEERPYWGGWYRASVAMDYNTDAKRLGFDKESDTAETQKQKQTVFIWPGRWALVAYGLVLALIVGAITYVILRHKKGRQRRREWVNYTVAEGVTLERIAAKTGVNWKLIAKENRIRAPYSLQPGQRIKIPAPQRAKKPKDSSTKSEAW